MLGILADAARSRDVARFTSLIEQQGRVRTRAEGLARDYGFVECGSGRGKAG